jgi:hypothetical protein
VGSASEVNRRALIGSPRAVATAPRGPRPHRRLAHRSRRRFAPSRADDRSRRRRVKRWWAWRATPPSTSPACQRASRGCGSSGTGIEHRRAVIPSGLVGTLHAERWRAGGTRRGNLGRHAEMPEDPVDHRRFYDERDEAQTAATPGTRQHIKDQTCEPLTTPNSDRGPDAAPPRQDQPHAPGWQPSPSLPNPHHLRMADVEPPQPARPPAVPARHGTKSG